MDIMGISKATKFLLIAACIAVLLLMISPDAAVAAVFHDSVPETLGG